VSVRLYMDVHVRRAVTDGLRLRGVDVITAQEDNARELEDSDLLDRANALGRVLFSQDDDLLGEAKRRQESGETFAGVIYAHQLEITIGQCVSDLELIAAASQPQEWINSTAYLPLVA
jgi:predicted nuclease of predicted toxin-antitoxin system